MPLPIESFLPALLSAIESKGEVVLQAEPGAGKTTRVPLACLEASWLKGQRIIMLEPRRLAALGAAHYMASLIGEPVGQRVGYRIRGERMISKSTRLEVLTEGILTRMLQEDQALGGVGMLIFDEFHERSIHADLGLALALEAKATLRPDLKIVLMSATLEREAVAKILPQAECLFCPGRTFPVETIYVEPNARLRLEQHTAEVINRALVRHSGDILVFLPGRAEIARCQEHLQQHLDQQSSTATTLIVALSSEVGLDAQKRALAPTPAGKRKVILATNIAETSLTIDGIAVVIDSGLMRSVRFDTARGMSALTTTKVSQASAEQRRGRAGRLSPGVCYRLWSETEQAKLPAYYPAEILNADLLPLALELALWGTRDAASLRFIDPPSPTSLESARLLLHQLGALDHEMAITAHGRQMATLAIHPRLAHMLIRAKTHGAETAACDLAAIIEERDLLQGETADVTLSQRFSILQEFKKSGRCGAKLSGLLRRINEQSARLRGLTGISSATASAPTVGVPNIGVLCAYAYPDRIARRRDDSERRYLLSNGAGAELPPQSMLARSRFLAIVGLDARAAHSRILLAEPLSEQDIETNLSDLIEERSSVTWDMQRERVVAHQVHALGSLVLSEKPLEEATGQSSIIMLNAIRHMGIGVLPWDKESLSLQLRSEWLLRQKLVPEAWPDLGEESLLNTLEEWLLPYLDGITSKAALSKLSLAQILRALFTYENQKRLDSLAPVQIDLPSGKQAYIDYERGDPPVLAIYLQEMYGQKDTPRIAGGKVALLLELLSPSRKPLQITKDLASFWANAYSQVRKEMIGRYPKHFWPEDPMAHAPGTRRKGNCSPLIG